MKKVAVIMGSDSDLPIVEKCIEELKKYEIPTEVHVYSAHRTPDEAIGFAKAAERNGFGVIISAAGKAAHLGGVLAANTVLPVVGIPIKASSLDGMDALLSTVQMPPGIPVASIAIDAEILAVSDEKLRASLWEERNKARNDVIEKDAAVSAKFN